MSMNDALLPHHDRDRQDDLAAEQTPVAPGRTAADEPDALPADETDDGLDAD